MKNSKMLLDVNDKPPLLKWLLLSLQHVFAMFGATILVPILVNKAVGSEVLSIPVALISSGIGTLIYIVCTKGKSPVYLGSSFAFITPMIVAFAKSGKESVFTGIMAVGLVYVLVALIIKAIGKKWINKLLPPIVVGPMIMIIGLSLAPTAIEEIGLNLEKIPWKNIVVALISFLTTGILAVRGKGFLKVILFLLGMVAGYISSIILGMVNLKEVFETSFIAVPNFYIPFVHYKLNFSALLTIAPIALVTISEHIGDHKVLSEIIGKDLIINPGLDNTLLGDGIATFTAGLIGGPANTTYGENTGVLAITKNYDPSILRITAVFAILLSFIGKFRAVIVTMPSPVMGGISLMLFSMIAIVGVQTIKREKVEMNIQNIIIIIAILFIGLSGNILSTPIGIRVTSSVSISGLSLAGIVGVILNQVMNLTYRKNK